MLKKRSFHNILQKNYNNLFGQLNRTMNWDPDNSLLALSFSLCLSVSLSFLLFY